ncbi:MAG: DNA primase, partial [Alistipes sp.]|nr:DNA primase [Alistipes sp.]
REPGHARGEGGEIPAPECVNHPDPKGCNAAVDILTSDDNYVPSALWKRKDIHVESDEEMLSHGVPKAITLYKSKIIERLIAEQQALLTDDDLTEEMQSEIMARLNKYNKVKVQIAKKIQRLIL